jgi:hypothetical protein
LRNNAVPATHSVKNFYRIGAYGIVKDLNWITHPVEADEGIFVVIAFQWAFVYFAFYRNAPAWV